MQCQTPAAGDRAPNLSIEPAKQQTMTRPIASERRRKRKICIRKYAYCDGGSPLRFASKNYMSGSRKQFKIHITPNVSLCCCTLWSFKQLPTWGCVLFSLCLLQFHKETQRKRRRGHKVPFEKLQNRHTDQLWKEILRRGMIFPSVSMLGNGPY